MYSFFPASWLAAQTIYDILPDIFATNQGVEVVDLSYNGVKCKKNYAILNLISSTFFQSQSNFV